jgi:hypothetical protein
VSRYCKISVDLLLLTISSDMGADMPEVERKRFAAKAVKDIMMTI